MLLKIRNNYFLPQRWQKRSGKKYLRKQGLTASAGISINKLVAKIASDYNKPNGQKTVPPEEVISFLEDFRHSKISRYRKSHYKEDVCFGDLYRERAENAK